MEKQLEGCIESGDDYGRALGLLAILLTALIQSAESNKANISAKFDWNHLKVPAAEGVRRCLGLDLARLLVVRADRDAVVSHLVRATHSLLEGAPKLSGLKDVVLAAWIFSAKQQGHGEGLRTLLLQDIQYFEALMEPQAEFLSMLGHQSEVSAAVLESIGCTAFGSGETGAVRNITILLTTLAKLSPRTALRSLSSLIPQLDSESPVLRCAMVEVLGLILAHLSTTSSTNTDEEGEESEERKAEQAKALLGVLEERLFDGNAFVRARVLHVLAEGLRGGWIPIRQRAQLLAAVIQRLRDKSSSVRRKAIHALGDFLRTHPFCVEGGELSLGYFEGRLVEIDKLLTEAKIVDDVIQPESEADALRDGHEEEEDAIPDDNQESTSGPQPQQLATLLLQRRYYTDAVHFVRQLEAVLPTLGQLLGSTIKTEVADTIDFLVEAHAYHLDGAENGVRRMIHLVWERDGNSDGPNSSSVKEHLFAAYKRIYLETEPGLAGRVRCERIADGLMSMVQGASTAELASLEPLMAGLLDRRWIPDGVFQILMGRLQSGCNSDQRRSILVLLALMAGPCSSLLAPRIDLVLRSGLASDTDPLAAQYALKTLRCLAVNGARLPSEPDNPVFSRLIEFCRMAPLEPAWLEACSEAVRAIYSLAATPSPLLEGLIRQLHSDVFDQAVDEGEDTVEAGRLTRLLHIVGIVASAESAHLDTIERHWKASRAASRTAGKGKSATIDELDMISGAGTAPEDDFADSVAHVRDRELLHGETALLALYGPMVACIAGNQSDFPDQALQRVASLTLARFMAISSGFCQEHLALFLTILERSPDAVIRCNLVVAFADLLQSHARIIDANITFLFARLSDSDSAVRRNTLLVLTHLTLTGLVKVKGQIGDIARCLLDPDERIADLARAFFHELAGKDPAIIYNHLPDILSSLTAPTSSSATWIDEADFQAIMRFVMQFIRKERQLESLVDKLCQRFRLCATARQARDVAFCLSLLSFSSDKSLRRLVDEFPLYQDKLGDPETLHLFGDILQRAKKTCRGAGTVGAAAAASKNGDVAPTASVGEVKSLFEEFESKLLHAAGELAEGSMAMVVDDDDEAQHNRKQSAKGKKKTSRSKKFQLPSSDEEDDDDENAGLQSGGLSDIESGEEAIPQPKVREKIKILRRHGSTKVTCDF